MTIKKISAEHQERRDRMKRLFLISIFALSSCAMDDDDQLTMCEIENRGHAVYCNDVLCDCTGDESNFTGAYY